MPRIAPVACGVIFSPSVSTRLKQARKARRLSAERVATDVGTHRQNYYRIERGDQPPKRELARRIFEYFDREVPLAHIYDPDYATTTEPAGRVDTALSAEV